MILANNCSTRPSYQQEWHKEQQPSYYAQLQQKANQFQESRDNELYQVCRQLTHENQLLKKENMQLKKQMRMMNNQHQNTFVSMEQKTQQQEEYRQINYQNYKKKATRLLTAVKYLYYLYTERQRVKKDDDILLAMMDKMSKGGSNIIVELVKTYESQNTLEQIDLRGDLEDFAKNASEHQNQLLRKHVKKMNKVLLESVNQIRKNLLELEADVANKKQKIDLEVQYYCQKYLNFNQKTTQEEIKSNEINHKKMKKGEKKSKENINVEKIGWKEVANQRAKLQEKKKNPTNNFTKGLQINTEGQSSPICYSMPLSKQASRPPKPNSSSNSLYLKHQTTVTDQSQFLKNTRQSMFGITPKSRVSQTKSQLKENSHKKKNLSMVSSNNSGRKYYR